MILKQDFQSKLFRCNEKSKTYNKWFRSFDFVEFSTTNVNRFKLSITHSNSDRPKTSKRSKKFAQLVRASIRNEFSLFYIQVIEKELESNDSDRHALIAKHKELEYRYILKNISNDDFDKNIAKYFRQKEMSWRFRF